MDINKGMDIKKEAAQWNIEIDDNMLSELSTYADMMLEYNEKVNLTAITEEEEIKEKHFLDSISLIKSGKLTSGCSLIDIGAGAGFPSIPVKIARKDIKLTMLDSLNKRVVFLQSVAEKLGFEDARAIHLRAEDAGHDEEFREKYDIATARAVADLAVLSEYALPFVKTGGYFIAMKSADIEEELESAKGAIKKLGGKTESVVSVVLPSGIERKLVIIKKIEKTQRSYPRKAGKPLKNPLK